MTEDEEIEAYNPYCKVCGNCGEDGCCSAMACQFTNECEYKETYIEELKFAYLMYHDLLELFDGDDKYKEQINQLIDKNFDIIYKDRKSN